MLTGELTQRMQVVTTKISERVEHLMDMPVATTATAAGTSRTQTAAGVSGRTKTQPASGVIARATPATEAPRPAAPAAPSAPVSPVTEVTATGMANSKAIETQVAGALGEVAMLLNNVEVRGLGRGGGRFGGPPESAGPGTVTSGTAAAEAALRAGTVVRPLTPQDRSGQPGGRGRGGDQGAPTGTSVDASAQGQGREGDGRGPRRFRFDGPPPDGSGPGGDRGGPPPPGPTVADDDPTHLKIDLAPIRRDLFREMAPNGSFDTMTPEERQRVGAKSISASSASCRGFNSPPPSFKRRRKPQSRPRPRPPRRTRPVPPTIPTTGAVAAFGAGPHSRDTGQAAADPPRATRAGGRASRRCR